MVYGVTSALSQPSHKEVKIVSRLWPIASEQAFAFASALTLWLAFCLLLLLLPLLLLLLVVGSGGFEALPLPYIYDKCGEGLVRQR